MRREKNHVNALKSILALLSLYRDPGEPIARAKAIAKSCLTPREQTEALEKTLELAATKEP